MYNKKMLRDLFVLIFFATCSFAEEAKPVLQDIDYTAVIEQKMKLEAKLENFVNGTLNEMLGPGKAAVKLDITPNVEKSRVETESWAKQESETGGDMTSKPVAPTEFLPGIPHKQDVVQQESKETAAGQTSGAKRSIESIVKIPESFIKKMDVTLIVSQSVPEESFKAAMNLVKDILGIDEGERGDKFTVRRVQFSPFKKLLPYLTNPYFYLVLIGVLVILLFFAFLFGPVSKFLFSLLATMKDLKQMKSEVEATGGSGGGGGGGVGVAGGEIGELGEFEKSSRGEKKGKIERTISEIIASLPVPGEEVGKMSFKPFQFVEDKDLKKIAYLLINENPEVIATVIHYLDDEKGIKLLTLFPEEKRADIIFPLSKVQFVEQSKISCLERIIKRRIDLTSGGVDRLVNFLSAMDEKAREAILNSLSEQNPEIAEKIKQMIFSFKNLADLEDRILQTVLGEINAPELAVALKGMEDDFKNKILGNLSEAARKLVEEESEAGRAVQAGEGQVADQRREIVLKVRTMEAEGKIDLGSMKDISVLPEEITAVSEKSIMEEVEEEMKRDKKREEERSLRREKLGMEEEVPVRDNEKAFEHYSAGGDYFQEGNYEKAAEEFREAIKYNPEIWQSYQYFGSTLFALGREEEAIRAYEKSLSLNPGNDDLKKWLEEHGPGAGEKIEEKASENATEKTSGVKEK
ncbi:MAG: FliG C-terminal domain-containing protein [bacterium]